MPRRAKICQSIFQVLADLEHARVFQHALERFERGLLRNLVRREAWAPARTGRCRPACRRRDGRAARSRLRCRRPRARSRTAARSSDRGWWSRCRSRRRRCPWRAATQAFSRSSVRTVSYLLRSILLRLRRGEMRGGERGGREIAGRLRPCCAAAAAGRTGRRSCRRAAGASRAGGGRSGSRGLARRQLARPPRSRSPRCRTFPRRAASASMNSIALRNAIRFL